MIPVWIAVVALIIIAVASSLQCCAEWFIRREIRNLLSGASGRPQVVPGSSGGVTSAPVPSVAPKGRVVVLSERREAEFVRKQQEGENE